MSSAVLRVPDLLTQLSGQARVGQRSVGRLLLVLGLVSLSGLGARAGVQLLAEGHESVLPQVQLRRDAQVV